MLVSKMRKFVLPDAKPPTPNLKFALTLTQNPNASQWNIGCVGYQTHNFCIGHVHFMFFVLISCAFGSKRKPNFQWNMGFIVPEQPMKAIGRLIRLDRGTDDTPTPGGGWMGGRQGRGRPPEGEHRHLHQAGAKY